MKPTAQHDFLIILLLLRWTRLLSASSYTGTQNTLARCTAHAGPEVCAIVKIDNQLCNKTRAPNDRRVTAWPRSLGDKRARYVGTVRREREEKRLLATRMGCPPRGWSTGCLRFYYNFEKNGVIELSVSVKHEGSHKTPSPLWTMSSSSFDLDEAQVPIRTKNGLNFQIVFKAERRPSPGETMRSSSRRSGAYIDRIQYKYYADASCQLHPRAAKPTIPQRDSRMILGTSSSTTARLPAMMMATSEKVVESTTDVTAVIKDATAKPTPSIVTPNDGEEGEDESDKKSRKSSAPAASGIAVNILVLIVVVIIAVEGLVLINRKSKSSRRKESDEDEEVDDRDDDNVRLIGFHNDDFGVGSGWGDLHQGNGSERTAFQQNISNSDLDTSTYTE